MKKLSFLFAALVAVFSANSEVLVYEGFDATEYSLSATTVKDLTTALKSPYGSIGVVSSNWEGMGGTQPKVFGTDFGLDFPREMKDQGFAARGGSAGMNPGTNSSDFRAQRHALKTDVMKVSDGKLYLRVLLNVDEAAAGKLSAKDEVKNASGGYYGFGLSSVISGNEYYLLSKGPSAMSFAVWRKGTSAENQLAISFVMTDTSSVLHQCELLSGVEVGETYICYAEIDVNAGTDGAEVIKAGAQKCSDYNVVVPWIDAGEVDILSDASYPKTMAVAGPYGSNQGKFRADEFIVATTKEEVIFENAGTPKLESAEVSWNAETEKFEVEIAMELNTATVSALAKLSDDDENPVASDAVEASPARPGVVSFAGLTAGKTYSVTAFAVNDKGQDSCEAGILHNGGLSIVKVSDADEFSYAPATFKVSRANADALDLSVEVSVTTLHPDAAEGKTWVKPEAVVIPSGATSATVKVFPLLDPDVTEDVTITVAVLTGTTRNSADALIRNLALPADRNVWISPSNSVASLDCNWSAGRAPVSTDAVLFDGRFSNSDCIWGDDAAHTVASWVQNNGYTGTVTLETVFPGKGDFTVLTVTGAMNIESGTLTHPQSRTMGDNHNSQWDWLGDLLANETYRLSVKVDSLIVGAEGMVDAKGMGYYASHDSARSPVPSHGGCSSGYAPYDDPKCPIHIGLPYHAGNNYYNGKGGGAIYIVCDGTAIVNGVIRADSSDGSFSHGAGAAGSVYLAADSLSGTGTISANGNGGGDGNYKGTGGRVAIVTSTPVNRSSFTAISAQCEWKNSQGNYASEFGGAGTVFFKDSTMTYGKLVVAEKSDRTGLSMNVIKRYTTVGTDGDWTFDSVEIAKNSFLIVPAGTSLHLPAGLTSVTGTATGTALGGIIYKGGTFDIGQTADQTVSGNWILVGWSNLVLNANVTVSGNAAIGVPPVGIVSDSGSALPTILTSSVTVNGNLTVASDGLLPAFNCGFRKTNQWVSQGVLGHAAHGGRIMAAMSQDITCKSAYDSVFAPCLPGCGIPWPNGQGVGNSGGAMKLVVSGAFTMNGVANASGSPEEHGGSGNNGGGAGGSIDITAGSLTGNGRITADGGSYSWMSGPGGRIAIKLTDPSADFADFTGLIRATGRSRGSHGGAQGSAGTIYLKTGAEGDFAGTVKIACPKYDDWDNWLAKTSTTEIVSLGYGGDAVADYKKVKVEVRDYGRAAVNTDVQLAQMTVATADAFVDLEGHTLTVNTFRYPVDDGNGGTKLAKLKPGTYTLDQLKALGINCVYDSVGGGSLIVKGTGLMLLVR